MYLVCPVSQSGGITILKPAYGQRGVNEALDAAYIYIYNIPALLAVLIQVSFIESVTIWTWRIRFRIKINAVVHGLAISRMHIDLFTCFGFTVCNQV